MIEIPLNSSTVIAVFTALAFIMSGVAIFVSQRNRNTDKFEAMMATFKNEMKTSLESAVIELRQDMKDDRERLQEFIERFVKIP